MKRSVEIAIHFVFFLTAILIVLLLYEFVTLGYSYQGHMEESVLPLRFFWQYEQTRREMLMIVQFALIYGLITFYAFYAFFKPVFFDQKKYGLFILSVIAWICILVFYRGYQMGRMYHPALILRDILIPSLFILSGTAFRFFRDWFTDQKQKEMLQKQNLQSQLELLKARINPHFLFNTINNIDVLIRKDPSIASNYLYKLSDTLRYVLYETQDEQLPLRKEVEQMEKFIDLQRIRTSNPDYVILTMSGTITDQKIAPMIFMTFVENAIKYTLNKKIKKAINISLDVKDNDLLFICRNYVGDQDHPLGNGNGLGLDLIKQRLELLYKDKYVLNASKDKDWYQVNLKLILHDR